MCLILFAARAHPRYPLIVAANRDEAYRRPTADAAFWPDQPHIYGGRDLEQGGTWLGVAQNGRFAAVTNYRLGRPRAASTRSRGELTRDYLAGNEDARTYLKAISARARDYNGFSLIAGNLDRLYFFSNHGAGIEAIAPGVHGLSNHLLDEPWPKVKQGVAVLGALLGASEDDLTRRLFDVLADRTPAPVELLPATGIGMERERDLSSSFIAGETYGTRASTVLLVGADGEALFRERSYGARGAPLGQSERRFRIDCTLTARSPAPARG
jgi:uncharacterized protein with NRDE domain